MAYEFVDEPTQGRYEFADSPTSTATPSASAQNVPPKQPLGALEKVVFGALDPVHGGTQLLTNALPSGLVGSVNKFNNWLADNTGMVARIPDGGVNQMVREREREYQDRRAAGGESGLDGWRVVGNVVSPANRAIPAGSGLLGGTLSGAASASIAPVDADDYWGEKGKQVAVGGAFGGGAQFLAKGASRIISPNASVNPNVQLLRSEGVRPTLGQTLGGMANRVEEKLTSLPVIGDAISSARARAALDLNSAAFNRALAPISQKMPPGMVGREAVQYVDDAISSGYNKLLPNLTLRNDQQLSANIGNLRNMVRTGAMDPRAAKAFERILDNDVLSKFQGRQAMTGQTLKQVESDLTQQISRLGASTDADQRLVGDALKQVREELRQGLSRSNPAQAPALQKLNTAWANFKRVQRAASGVGAEEGVFSSAQLQNAIKAMDRSKDKGRFASGSALMQDLGDAGKSVLGSKVPDSGTPGRLFLSGGAAGASLLDPTMTAPLMLGGGAMLYTGPLQKLLTGSVASRPQAAQGVANTIRKAAPSLVLPSAQIGLNLAR